MISWSQWFIIKLFACLVQFMLQVNGNQHSLDLLQCEPTKPLVKQDFFDAHFTFDCSNLFNEKSSNIRKCSAFDENGIYYPNGTVFNISSDNYEANQFGEKYGNLSYIVAMNTTTGSCQYKNVTMMLEISTRKLCLNFMDEEHVSGKLSVIQKTYGDYATFTCDDQNSVLPPGAVGKQIKTVWYKNCGFDDISQKGLRKGRLVARSDGKPDDLKMSGMDFYSAGNYTCAVQYDGRLYVVAQYSLCIKQRVNRDSYQPTLTCAGKQVVAEHGNVHIECKAQVSAGQIPHGEISVRWENKTKEVLCSNNAYKEDTIDEKYKCNMNGANETIWCEDFKYGYHDKYVQEATNEVLINLYITDVLEKQFATDYTVTLQHLGKVATATTSLERDWSPYFKNLKNIFVPISIGFGVAFVLVGFIFYFQLEIRWLMKRYSCCGKYVSNDKKYVFCLLYDFDREDKSADDIKHIRNVICETANDLQYDYFDQDTDPDPIGGVKVEVVTKAVNESHSMVVIVTKNFIQNNWARFQSKVCVSSTTPIIFVFTPGTRKLLDSAEGWKTITKIVKVSYTIGWNKKMSDSRLKKHIEVALPKIKPKKIQRQNSDENRSMDSVLLSPTSLYSAVSADQLLPI